MSRWLFVSLTPCDPESESCTESDTGNDRASCSYNLLTWCSIVDGWYICTGIVRAGEGVGLLGRQVLHVSVPPLNREEYAGEESAQRWYYRHARSCCAHVLQCSSVASNFKNTQILLPCVVGLVGQIVSYHDQYVVPLVQMRLATRCSIEVSEELLRVARCMKSSVRDIQGSIYCHFRAMPLPCRRVGSNAGTNHVACLPAFPKHAH